MLSGRVSSNAVMLRAGGDRRGDLPKKKVINMLQLPGGAESQQVMLQVRFAEVNRRAFTELGVIASSSAQPAYTTGGPVHDAAVRRAGLRRRRAPAASPSATS